MATAVTSKPTAGLRTSPRTGRGATAVVVAVLGALVGVAGVEHGVGEILQGSVRPDGLLIMSWPDAPALEILSGEPALTVIPNMLVSGIVATVVGLAVVVWSVWFAPRRHGGWVLVGLSGLLLLVGGGLVPPLMGAVVGAVATRIGATSRHTPGPLARAIGSAWPWFLAVALVGYLGLMPGMVLASTWGLASEVVVIALAAVAFTGFALTLVAARAYDRLRTAVGR